MPYFYHYTSEEGYAALTANAAALNTSGVPRGQLGQPIDVAGEKLQAARVSYHRLVKRLENQFHIREYQRDQEKQEAVRQAKAQPNQVHRYSKRRQHEERQRAS